MGKISLSKMKSEIKKSGANKGKILYFKEGEKHRVRFLSDFEDGLEVKFHDSYALGVNVPCQEEFGRDCEYCEEEDLRTRNMYFWSVYDYEAEEVKLIMFAVNNCTPVGALASLYESYGTLLDRDYEITKRGSGQSTQYSVVPLKERKFRNTKVKALSDEAILKIIDKAYPADNSEDVEEDEPKRRTKANKTKGKKDDFKKKMNEPEDDTEEWDDEKEGKEDYESMTAQELYKLCKKSGIECKPKKAKEYYIDLLEELEDEQEGDDWDEEDEEADEWEE